MVFPSIIKAPSTNILEGDPPIGKERGALGVGTGPAPPTNPLTKGRIRRRMKKRILQAFLQQKPGVRRIRKRSKSQRRKR